MAMMKSQTLGTRKTLAVEMSDQEQERPDPEHLLGATRARDEAFRILLSFACVVARGCERDKTRTVARRVAPSPSNWNLCRAGETFAARAEERIGHRAGCKAKKSSNDISPYNSTKKNVSKDTGMKFGFPHARMHALTALTDTLESWLPTANTGGPSVRVAGFL